MAEFDDQFVGGIFSDPIVECGREVLGQLDQALKNDEIPHGVTSVTNIGKYPDPQRLYWETTTTYTAEVMDGISPELLKQVKPPTYFYGILGGLVLAQIYHENQRHSRDIPLFSPDKTELDAHVLALWTMLPDNVRNMTDTAEYTLPIHHVRDTTLELHKPAGSDTWKLLFAHRLSHVRLIVERDDDSVTIVE